MLMSWPDAAVAPMRIDGRARDLLTGLDGTATVRDEVTLAVTVGAERTITDITSDPPSPDLAHLVGARGGGNLRRSLAEAVPHEREAGTPLYLLLDDIAGCTLIGGFAWSRWRDVPDAPIPRFDRALIPVRVMEGICSGFRPGSSALLPDGTQSGLPQNVAPVPPLVDPDDPLGWHDQHPVPPVAMRRSRRIDVGRVGAAWEIDAMFRDSTWDPDGTEVAVHEYQLRATADPDAGVLMSVTAVPRIVPYAECPGAAANASWMVGVPLAEMRTEVLERLRATDCCTHLNDALRSLAEVPAIAAPLLSA